MIIICITSKQHLFKQQEKGINNLDRETLCTFDSGLYFALAGLRKQYPGDLVLYIDANTKIAEIKEIIAVYKAEHGEEDDSQGLHLVSHGNASGDILLVKTDTDRMASATEFCSMPAAEFVATFLFPAAAEMLSLEEDKPLVVTLASCFAAVAPKDEQVQSLKQAIEQAFSKSKLQIHASGEEILAFDYYICQDIELSMQVKRAYSPLRLATREYLLLPAELAVSLSALVNAYGCATTDAQAGAALAPGAAEHATIIEGDLASYVARIKELFQAKNIKKQALVSRLVELHAVTPPVEIDHDELMTVATSKCCMDAILHHAMTLLGSILPAHSQAACGPLPKVYIDRLLAAANTHGVAAEIQATLGDYDNLVRQQDAPALGAIGDAAAATDTLPRI